MTLLTLFFVLLFRVYAVDPLVHVCDTFNLNATTVHVTNETLEFDEVCLLTSTALTISCGGADALAHHFRCPVSLPCFTLHENAVGFVRIQNCRISGGFVALLSPNFNMTFENTSFFDANNVPFVNVQIDTPRSLVVATQTLVVTNSTFQHCRMRNALGCIHVIVPYNFTMYLKFNTCVMTNFTTRMGSPIKFGAPCTALTFFAQNNVELTNLVITNMSSTADGVVFVNGGDVRIVNVTALNARSFRGGFLNVCGRSTLQITDFNVTNVSVFGTEATGGVFALWDETIANISHVYIVGSRTEGGNGGVIGVGGPSVVTVNDMVVIGTSADYGAVVCAWNLARVSIANSKVVNTNGTGAFYVGDEAYIRLVNVSIENSYTTMGGGILVGIDDSKADLTNIVARNLTSATTGGAFALHHRAIVRVENISIENTTAQRGAFASLESDSKLYLNSSSITKAFASEYGGFVLARGNSMLLSMSSMEVEATSGWAVGGCAVSGENATVTSMSNPTTKCRSCNNSTTSSFLTDIHTIFATINASVCSSVPFGTLRPAKSPTSTSRSIAQKSAAVAELTAIATHGESVMDFQTLTFLISAKACGADASKHIYDRYASLGMLMDHHQYQGIMIGVTTVAVYCIHGMIVLLYYFKQHPNPILTLRQSAEVLRFPEFSLRIHIMQILPLYGLTFREGHDGTTAMTFGVMVLCLILAHVYGIKALHFVKYLVDVNPIVSESDTIPGSRWFAPCGTWEPRYSVRMPFSDNYRGDVASPHVWLWATLFLGMTTITIREVVPSGPACVASLSILCFLNVTLGIILLYGNPNRVRATNTLRGSRLIVSGVLALTFAVGVNEGTEVTLILVLLQLTLGVFDVITTWTLKPWYKYMKEKHELEYKRSSVTSGTDSLMTEDDEMRMITTSFDRRGLLL
eukprot:PhF_6_TR577/c0_g1_i6/m.613